MKYYFSSPTPRKKELISSGAKRFLLSFAVDGKSVKKHFDNYSDIIIDSGAFSVWNKGNGKIDIDEYLNFCRTLPETYTFINLDVIPETNSTKKEISKCVEQSFENFKYLTNNLKNVLPVHHYGENLSILDRYLDYTDYVAISPANDTHENVKRKYLKEIYTHIDYSKIKTHALGYSSFEGLKLFPFYSVDSISYARFKIRDKQFLSSSTLEFYQLKEIKKFIQYENFITRLWEERGLKYD